MKTTNWENPERYLELQFGNQPTSLLNDQLTIIRQLQQAIPRAFLMPVDWKKIETWTRKSAEPTINYYYEQLIVVFFFFLILVFCQMLIPPN